MTEMDNETAAAVAILEDKGLATVPRTEEERDYEFDKLLTGRPPAVKFEEPGQFVQGTVVEKLVQQRKDFDSGEPMWNDDGSPRLDPLVVLNTPDDGMVTLYMASWRLAKAVGDAVRAAGERRIRRDGTLLVRFTGLGEPYKKGAQPPKEYEAAYDPPGGDASTAAALNVPELAPRSFAGELSAACTRQDHDECDSRKCVCSCHSASKPPEQLTGTDDAPPPF